MATSKNTEILVNDSVIKKEKRKLMKIFEKAVKEVDEDGKKRFTDKGIMLEGLIDEAAFVRSVLLEAKRLIKNDGIETTTINGTKTASFPASASQSVIFPLCRSACSHPGSQQQYFFWPWRRQTPKFFPDPLLDKYDTDAHPPALSDVFPYPLQTHKSE